MVIFFLPLSIENGKGKSFFTFLMQVVSCVLNCQVWRIVLNKLQMIKLLSLPSLIVTLVPYGNRKNTLLEFMHCQMMFPSDRVTARTSPIKHLDHTEKCSH